MITFKNHILRSYENTAKSWCLSTSFIIDFKIQNVNVNVLQITNQRYIYLLYLVSVFMREMEKN